MREKRNKWKCAFLVRAVTQQRYLSVECQETVKNVPKVTPFNFIFYPTNSPKCKDIQFTIIQDKKQSFCLIQRLIDFQNSCYSNSNSYKIQKLTLHFLVVLKADFSLLPYGRLSLHHGNKTDSTSDRVGLCGVKLETCVESLPDPIWI